MFTKELLPRLSAEFFRGNLRLILALSRLARSVILANCFSLSAIAFLKIFYLSNSLLVIVVPLDGILVNVYVLLRGADLKLAERFLDFSFDLDLDFEEFILFLCFLAIGVVLSTDL